MADVAERTGSARPPAATALSSTALVTKFESLGGAGHGSEFGLFQRIHGLGELGLLGWADLNADLLTLALEQQFDGVGEAGNTVIFRPDSSEEWWTRDTRYWMAMRSQVRVEGGNLDQAAPAVLDRLRKLRSALIQDLRDGQKIFVFRDITKNLSDTALARLLAAIRAYGSSTLFYLRYADPAHPPGVVEVAAPNLLIGYVDHFGVSRDHRGLGAIDDVLLDLCRKAWALADRAAAPMVLAAPAPDPVVADPADTPVTAARKAVARAPRSLDARLFLAEALRRAGQVGAAVTETYAAAVLAPDDVRAYAALGDLMQAIGDRPGAEAAYRKAIALAPGEADYHHQLSLVYATTGRLAEAIPAAEAAIAREPGNPLRLGYLAELLGAAGEYERARTAVLTAIDEMPEHVPLHIVHSTLYAREGRLQDALETARDTADQIPGHPDILAHLADIEQKCGHLQQAELHLRAALDLAPDSEKLRAQMVLLLEASAARDQGQSAIV